MHFYMNAHMSCQCLEPSLNPSHMHTSCMKNLHFQNKIFLFYISNPWTVSENPLYSKSMCLLWVTNFLGFHRRRRTPSNTFVDIHCWMDMFDQEYKPFHLRGCLSLIATTRHIISNRATLRCHPFFRARHLNTKHSVLSCHALTPVSRDVPMHIQCRMSLHVLSCYMHDESYMQHL